MTRRGHVAGDQQRGAATDDSVGIVVYAGAAGTVLSPTSGAQHGTITEAIRHLRAGGSTHGAAGIRAAYELPRSATIEGGINRVILVEVQANRLIGYENRILDRRDFNDDRVRAGRSRHLRRPVAPHRACGADREDPAADRGAGVEARED